MGDLVKQFLETPIQLTEQVIKEAGEAATLKQECTDLKSKAENLANLLRQVVRAADDLYDRPARRILQDTEQVVRRALFLVHKCRRHGLVRRTFTLIPATAFRRMSAHLESSIGDVSWLLHVFASADDRADDVILGLPPIALNEPILFSIWNLIADLSTGSLDDRASAAESLVSLARDNEHYGKLIIEEGGVGPLLKLVKEGNLEGQESAARAIGMLGRDSESVKRLIYAGVCHVLVEVLKEGQMKVQAVVAWAVSELAANCPDYRDIFAQHNIIRLLVGHLAFETVREHSKYAVTGKTTTTLADVVLASTDKRKAAAAGNDLDDEIKCLVPHPLAHLQLNQMDIDDVSTAKEVKGSALNIHYQRSHLLCGVNNKAREMEDISTKEKMKKMAALALWHLVKGNPFICQSIIRTESRALLCFAVLLQKGPSEVSYYSAMSLLEITAEVEKDGELRRSAFKPVCKAVVDQLLLVIEKADWGSELLLPCIKAIGNLARIFKASETRMIDLLVKLLDETEAEVTNEACVALTKFASSANYVRNVHSKTIIEAGGARHLVPHVYGIGGDPILQKNALILLCYITINVPDSEALAQAEVLAVLGWASNQAALIQEVEVDILLRRAEVQLELYRSRVSRGYHRFNSI